MEGERENETEIKNRKHRKKKWREKNLQASDEDKNGKIKNFKVKKKLEKILECKIDK